MVLRIVMGPMDNRFAPRIFHKLTPHANPIANTDRNRRCEINVIDDFERRSVVGRALEGFVARVGVGADEIMGRGCHDRAEIDLGR